MAKKGNFQIEGFKELKSMLKRIEKLPKPVITQSARAGARIVYKAARLYAPVDKGDLKRGLKLSRERSRNRMKTVYDVIMDPKKNNTFVKMSADGTKRYYYPASQEYGFLTVDGGYIPGYRFMKRAAEQNVNQVEKEIISTARKKVEALMKKG